jgi:uncharacterized protein (DUF1499 family)
VKTVFITVSVLIITCMVLLLVLGVISRSGKPPGLLGGKLLKCPDTPNCVSSEKLNDAAHYIEPIIIPAAVISDPLPALKGVIVDMGGSIQAHDGDYVAAVFSSAIFGFADDLEVRVDAAEKVIHIRSASRAGHGDAGVNRKRLELLKKRCTEEAFGNLNDDT